MTILIVEDEAFIRSMLIEFLQDEGYRVVTAANGVEALACLRQYGNKIRMILLDLEMPKMSGWQFREHQRRDSGLAAIPVILMSATLHLELSAEALDVAAYLDKPLDLPRLLDVITEYVQPPRQGL